MNLMKQYKTMVEEIRMYINMRESQPQLNALKQLPQRPNVNIVQSDSLKTKDESIHSQQQAHSYEENDKSNKGNEPSSTWSRRKKPETSQVDQDTKRDLEKIMRELQELKRVWKDLDPD